MIGIGVRPPNIEGMVAVHTVMVFFARRPVELILQHGRRRGCGVGVRHFKHTRHPAQNGSLRPCFEVFFMRRSGFAKMNLTVDHARQNVQPCRVQYLTGLTVSQIANGRNNPVFNSHIGTDATGLVHNCPVLDEQIKGLARR